MKGENSMDIKIKVRKGNEDEALNFLKDLDFASFCQCSISTTNKDIIIELKKEYVGSSQILKILKKMINFEDFSISFENNSNNEKNNNAKKHKKASVVSNNIPHDEIDPEELIKDPNMREAVKNIKQMQYLENNEKMFEMLNAFSHESKKYVDFIEKISEHFQFGDRSDQFKRMCTAYFRNIKISEPIKYYSGIHPVRELIFDSFGENYTITEMDIENRLGYTSLTLDFFKKKTEKNKMNFLELVNTTRKFKKRFYQ